MVRLKPGDRVEVRLKSNTIVSSHKEYDELQIFEIIATDDTGYYLYIPHHTYVVGEAVLDASKTRHLGVDWRFYDEKFFYISENMINGIKSEIDGMTCVRCKDFYKMAAANQPDGTLICWSCRKYPFWH